MPVLHMKEAQPAPERLMADLPSSATYEDELDTMVEAVRQLEGTTPDIVISTCMALMGRCTEMYIQLVRMENSYRRARFIRTQQVQKLMDLLDFQFKGASRLVEVARQELDTTR